MLLHPLLLKVCPQATFPEAKGPENPITMVQTMKSKGCYVQQLPRSHYVQQLRLRAVWISIRHPKGSVQVGFVCKSGDQTMRAVSQIR